MMKTNKMLTGMMAWGFPLLLSLISCSEKSSSELTLQQATLHKQVTLTNEENAPHCEIDMKLHYVTANGKGAAAAKAINDTIIDRLFFMQQLTVQEAIDSFANQYSRDYVSNLLPLYQENKAKNEQFPWYECYYNMSSDTRQDKSGTLNYIVELEYFEGGAHGVNQKLAMNFDTNTGQLLTLNDLLVPGYEKRLNDLLLKALMEKTKAANTEQLNEMGYLVATEIYAPENYIVGKDSITFIYNPYEIAPYAMGKTELSLGYDELKELMPAE